MNQDDQKAQRERQQALSALMDGEATEAELACRAWREDAGARADWHAYHLIGELMRSDEVRWAPQRDAHFLDRLRTRLADEPVVLAPTTTAATARQGTGRRAWVAPLAVAAGFVAVAGVLVVMRVAAPDGALPDRSALASNRGAAAPASVPVGAFDVDGRVIRNAELDRYLAAHKQYSNTSALAVPGGMVRNAATAAPGR